MRSLLLIPLVVTACDDRAVVVGGLQEVAQMKAIPNPDLDLLFVIDDSPSMADKQAALAAAFPRMIDVLAQLDGGLPNLHIGVVTSDMGTSASSGSPGPAIGSVGNGGCSGRGDDGRLQSTASMTAAYLSDVKQNGARVRNFTGELRDVFGELAQVGAGGCGFEQHLSAMRAALTSSTNTGFLRPSANLAVVFLADEDDCSASNSSLFGPDSAALGPLQSFRCFRFGVTCDQGTNEVGAKTDCVPSATSQYLDDVEPFIEALIATKNDPRKIMVAAIIGDTQPVSVELRAPPGGGTAQYAISHSCSFVGVDGPTVADPGLRLAAFLDAFPGRSTMTSVCSGDLTNPLGVIGQSAKQLVGDPCLDTTVLADTSPEPGVQPSCEVVDIRDAAPDAPTSVAPCTPGSSDCYDLLADQVACPASTDHLRVKIKRTAAVSDDTWTSVRCKRAE